MKWLLLACCSILPCAGQTPVQPNLDKLVYPPLARAARIQGTVRFAVNAGEVQLIYGHPILVGAAKANVESWATIKASDSQFFVNYVFRLAAAPPKVVESEKLRGDAFDRFFLRLFHKPVTRKVTYEVCDASGETSTNFTIGIFDDRPIIEVDVTAQVSCIETNTTYVARSN